MNHGVETRTIESRKLGFDLLKIHLRLPPGSDCRTIRLNYRFYASYLPRFVYNLLYTNNKRHGWTQFVNSFETHANDACSAARS